MEELHKNNIYLIQLIRPLMLLALEELVQMMHSKPLTVLRIKRDKEIQTTTSITLKEIHSKNLMVVNLQLVILIFNVEPLKKKSSQNHMKQPTESNFHNYSHQVPPKTTWTKQKTSLVIALMICKNKKRIWLFLRKKLKRLLIKWMKTYLKMLCHLSQDIETEKS